MTIHAAIRLAEALANQVQLLAEGLLFAQDSLVSSSILTDEDYGKMVAAMELAQRITEENRCLEDALESLKRESGWGKE